MRDPCASDVAEAGDVGHGLDRAIVACGSDDDCAADAPYCDPYSTCRCRPGFLPTIGANECVAFGATDVTGVPQACSGAGGAADSPGSAGNTGADGSPGSAGDAGGAG